MTGASVRAAIGIGLAIASTGLLVLVLTSHMMLGLDFASYSYGVTA